MGIQRFLISAHSDLPVGALINNRSIVKAKIANGNAAPNSNPLVNESLRSPSAACN